MTLARKVLFAAAVGVFALVGLPGAKATTMYATVVDDGNNDGNAAGFSPNVSGNTITYYAPLKGSGTYGVGGYGTSSSISQCCGTGTMDMWLQFDGLGTGSGLLTLDFTDLDVAGAETPAGFLETVTIFSAGNPTTVIDDISDLTSVSPQVVQIAVNMISDPFIVKLALTADTTGTGYRSGTWLMNTPEQLVASVTSVDVATTPVPAALPLFGTALAAFGFMRLRRKNAA